MSGGRNLILVCGLTIAALVAAAVYWLRPSGPRSAALTARELTMRQLGACLAKLQPGGKVLALSNPFSKDSSYLDEKSQFERAGLRGLRQGLGGRVSVEVVFPEIRPEFFSRPESVPIPPDCRTPLSFLVQPASVDRLAEAHADCRVIVSLIGLPAGVEQLKLWKPEDPRGFALLLPDLRLLGPPANAVAAFRRGKIVAVVTEDPRTGAPLVVTRDNVEEIVNRQPQALGY